MVIFLYLIRALSFNKNRQRKNDILFIKDKGCEIMEYQIKGKTLTVYLSGDIDHHSSDSIRKAIDTLIINNIPEKVCLNFKKVQFCDSSGIAVVLGRYKMSVKMDFKLCLEELPPSIENIFRLSKIDSLVEIKEKETYKDEKSYKQLI